MPEVWAWGPELAERAALLLPPSYLIFNFPGSLFPASPERNLVCN